MAGYIARRKFCWAARRLCGRSWRGHSSGDVGRRIYRARVSRRYAVRAGLAVFL